MLLLSFFIRQSYSINSVSLFIDENPNFQFNLTKKENSFPSKKIKATNFPKQNEIISGSCGEKITFELNTEDGILTLSGSGEMTNFSDFNSVPWYEYKDFIKSIK